MENEKKHQHCLRWNSHYIFTKQTLNDFRKNEILVDCTLFAEGHSLKAHKVVLSTCSGYLKKYFNKYSNNSHMNITFSHIKFKNLKLVIDYIYLGLVNVPVSEINDFYKIAAFLRVEGLSKPNTTDPREVVERNDNALPEIQHSSNQNVNNTHLNVHDVSVVPNEEFKADSLEIRPSNLGNLIGEECIDLTLDEDDNVIETEENSCAWRDTSFASTGKNINAGQVYSFATPSTSNKVFVNRQETLPAADSATSVSTSPREARQIQTYPCLNENCNKVFFKQITLKSHMANDCGKIYMCNGCKNTYRSLAGYCRHKKKCIRLKAFNKRMERQAKDEELKEKLKKLKVRSTPRVSLHNEDEDINVVD